MNPAAASMKVIVQFASSGSPAAIATTIAAAGASTKTLQPRNDSQTSAPRPIRMPASPMASDDFEQRVEIERRTHAEVVAILREEAFGGLAAFVPKHAKERPLRDQLRRVAEIEHDVARDAVDAHLRPHGTFAGAGVGDLTQQRARFELL